MLNNGWKSELIINGTDFQHYSTCYFKIPVSLFIMKEESVRGTKRINAKDADIKETTILVNLKDSHHFLKNLSKIWNH